MDKSYNQIESKSNLESKQNNIDTNTSWYCTPFPSLHCSYIETNCINCDSCLEYLCCPFTCLLELT